MEDWSARQYLKFEDERTRPPRDLVAQIPLQRPRLVVDLGCGPGNSTELLVERYPQSQIVGLDSSPDMLKKARERLPQCRFVEADIATWTPEPGTDLIFGNAVMQWLPDHPAIMRRMLEGMPQGGVLAIQMPDNRQEPTHRIMREVASEAPWANAIGDADKIRTELLGIEGYYDLFAGNAADVANVDVWRTAYQHPMASAAAIVEWVSGTGLKPFVDRLMPELKSSYLAEYERRIDAAYAPRADGRRLLAFPRMFIVAQRKA